MSVVFDIHHTTHYRYHQPVELGVHKVMFRPRGSHDLRVLASDLKVTPEAVDISLIMDVYSNSVAVVTPQSPATELKVECKFRVEHAGTRALDLPLAASATVYPFQYEAEESFALQHYLQPFYDDPTGELDAWARQFLSPDGSADTRELLKQMNQSIRDSMQYIMRFDEGVQTPYDTLRLRSGTCRDFATLMVEAVRRLGYAARFVSGYLYTPALDSGEAVYSGAGATHAWLQVYLPGAGWVEFDPTNSIVGSRDLIRVAVVRDAKQAVPLAGSWIGAASDCIGMEVAVRVTSDATEQESI